MVNTRETAAPKKSTARGRWSFEGAAQVSIMLVIGLAAGAGSFTHVHDVAAAHGQQGWLAWADAVVLELMSIASGLELRRRKRAGTSVAFPAAVLAVAVVLSLGAQVIDAEQSPVGWIAAAIPALGFLVMVKIALSHAGASAAVSLDSAPEDRIAEPSQDPLYADAVVAALLPAARSAAASLEREGCRLSRHSLAVALRGEGYPVSNARASTLLRMVRAERGDEVPVRRLRRVPAEPDKPGQPPEETLVAAARE
jgi:hypothetical protein